MSDLFENAANAMFPTARLASAPASAPAVPVKYQTDEERQAAVLFGETSPKPTAEKPVHLDEPFDDVEAAERFYEDSPIYENAKRDVINAALENLETPEAAAQIAQQYEPWMREFHLNSTEASELAQLGVSAAMNPPDEATVQTWAEASRQALRTEWGLRSGEALQAARQLIAKDHKLKTFLHETGLGSSPAFVRLAAQKAMDLKRRGKL